MTSSLEDGLDVPELPHDAWERRHEPAIREMLVLANWMMLRKVVGRLRQTLPQHVKVEEEDLRSYGLVGLYRALDKYDPEQGTEFSKYASTFVYGAVIDALRSTDWAPRSLRKRQKDLEKAKVRLRKTLGRDPNDPELAEELKWTVADIETTRYQADIAYPRSLDEIRNGAQDLYAVVADQQGSPETVFIKHHESHENDRSSILADKMASFIDGMSPQKRAVAIFCYYLGMKQGEVAEVLGVPESRVSSLHLSVMDDIHQRLIILLSTPE